MDDKQAYYDALVEMFATEGWKKTIEDLKGSVEMLTDQLSRGVDTEQYHFTVGRIHAYRSIIALPEMVDHAMKAAEQEKAGLDELP